MDAAGRRQYLYHASYRAAQEQAKYDRLVRFGELLPDLRKTAARHVRREPLAPEWTLAHAVTLINRAWFRVGSEQYARTSRTYGVTTLLKRHASVRGRTLRFTFRAKHRALVRTTLVDPDLAVGVAELLALPGGSRLFRFHDDGAYRNLTGQLLNDYLAEHLGGGFTAKDFRTGREPHRRGRARRARATLVRDRGEAGDRRGDAPGRGAARQHPRGRTRVLRQPCRARAVSRRPHA